MDQGEIECFLTLADELHFGRTATRLRITQARVTQTVQKLERRFGAPLFERTSRRVSLTPLGKQLEAGLRPAYGRLRDVIEETAQFARGVRGVLNVGFLGMGAGELQPLILDIFANRHPGCEVRLQESHFADPLGPLRAGDVDVLFTRLPVREKDLTVGPIVIQEPRVLAVSARHRLARHESVSLEELVDETTFGVRGQAPQYWWDAHVPPQTPSGKPIARGPAVETFQELMALIAAGRGVSPLVASVRDYHARPDIAFVPLSDAKTSEVALVWRTNGQTERVREFVAATRDAVTQNSGPAHR